MDTNSVNSEAKEISRANGQLVAFLRMLANDIENNNATERDREIAVDIHGRVKMIDALSQEQVQEDDLMKYMAMGWQVYNAIGQIAEATGIESE